MYTVEIKISDYSWIDGETIVIETTDFEKVNIIQEFVEFQNNIGWDNDYLIIHDSIDEDEDEEDYDFEFDEEDDVVYDEEGYAWWYDEDDEVWYVYDEDAEDWVEYDDCLLYTSPSPRDS